MSYPSFNMTDPKKFKNKTLTQEQREFIELLIKFALRGSDKDFKTIIDTNSKHLNLIDEIYDSGEFKYPDGATNALLEAYRSEMGKEFKSCAKFNLLIEKGAKVEILKTLPEYVRMSKAMEGRGCSLPVNPEPEPEPAVITNEPATTEDGWFKSMKSRIGTKYDDMKSRFGKKTEGGRRIIRKSRKHKKQRKSRKQRN